jgi:hypothetical protein
MGTGFDSLAVTIVIGSCLLALWDRRFLLVGWFLAAPYFSQSGKLNSINIASNVSHNLFIPLIFVITVVLALVERRKLVLPMPCRWYLIFLAYLIFSVTAIAGATYDGYRSIYIIYMLPFLLYLVLANTMLDWNFFKWVTGICFFHLVVLSLLAIQEYKTGLSIFTQHLMWKDVNRVAGPFYNPIIMGLFTFFLFIIIFVAWKNRHISLTLFWGVVICTLFIIYATLTRSVWIAFILSTIYYIFKSSKRTLTTIMMIGVFAISIFTILNFMLEDSRISKRLNTDTGSIRLVVTYSGFKMFLSEPLLGVGFGQYDRKQNEFFNNYLGIRNVNTRTTSHVTLMTLLAELGLLGTFPFVMFILKNIRANSDKIIHMDLWLLFGAHLFIIFYIVNAFLIDMRYFSVAYSLLFSTFAIVVNSNPAVRDIMKDTPSLMQR